MQRAAACLLTRTCACTTIRAASLQAWLEAAWQAGYDAAGGEMYGGAVQCSSKWIGAADAAALLRSFGCKAQIVEFTHDGERARMRDALQDCVHAACFVFRFGGRRLQRQLARLTNRAAPDQA